MFASVRTQLTAVVAVMTMGVGALLADAAPAFAWTGPSRIVSNNSAPLDWCPGNSSICQDNQRLTTLAPGTAVNMVCWIDARTDGYKYPRWFYVTASAGRQGFVKAELVTNQWPNSPSCDSRSSEQVKAVAVSLQVTGPAELGQVYPTSTDKFNALKYLGFNNWGKYGDWSGDCLMWSALAWLRGGDTMWHSGNAIDVAHHYKPLSGGTPPRGAAVFWNYGSLGHVAISLGNGEVATTQGTDDNREPTVIRSMSYMNSSLGNSLGWVAVP